MSELCPHCLDKALSGFNDTNKTRHLVKCKKQHPYPKVKPKARKQTKISFLPAPPAEPQAPLVDDFCVDKDVDVDAGVEKDLEDVVNTAEDTAE